MLLKYIQFFGSYVVFARQSFLFPLVHQGIILQVVLMTLTVYVEWVSVQYIFTEDGKLLQSLCFLLSQDNLKMEAAECLLQVCN